MRRAARPGRPPGWLWPVFFCSLALLPAPLAAQPGYLHTRSTEFYPVRRLGLTVGWERHEDRGPYGTWPLVYTLLPITLTTALVRNVQLGLTLPLAWVDNLARPERGVPPAAGDMLLDLEFGHDEHEYEYREAFTLRVRIPDTSPSIDRNRRYATLPREYLEASPVRDYYPLVRHSGELCLGWNLSKEFLPRTWVHFNARYTYEFGTNEGLTNMFALQGVLVNSNDVSSVSNLEAFQGTSFSLFGIEKIWDRLFGWTSRTDPWADKRNDHLELSLGVDTRFDLGYHVAGRSIPFAVQPFAELYWAKRFSEESLAKSHIELSAGAALHLPGNLRFQFALSRVRWAENLFEYQDSATMSVTILL